MFPGDQISDSPPPFNRPFDLYPRHGFGDAPTITTGFLHLQLQPVFCTFNYNRFFAFNAHASAGAVHEEMPFMGEGVNACIFKLCIGSNRCQILIPLHSTLWGQVKPCHYNPFSALFTR